MMFTPEEVTKIKELRRKQYSWAKIAFAIGRPVTTVYEHFAPQDILTAEQRQTILEQRRQGIPWRGIAQDYGVDQETLRNRMRRGKQTNAQTLERKKVEKEFKEKFSRGHNPHRKHPLQVRSFRADPEALAERERRYVMINKQLATDQLMGDPPQGYSALAHLSPERLKKIR